MPKFKIEKSILEELYITKQLRVKDIARKLGVSRATVTHAIKRFNLIRDPSIKMKLYKESCSKWEGGHPSRSKEARNRVSRNMKQFYKSASKEIINDRIKKATISIKQTIKNKSTEERLSQAKKISNSIKNWHKNLTSEKIKEMKEKMVLAHKNRSLEEIKLIQQKTYETKKRNGTLLNNQSKAEEQVYQLLLIKFPSKDIERQYRSNKFPFKCDFYIKSLDLYIEYNGGQYHYKEPFDKNNPQHIERFNKLKKKNFENPNSVYKNMIKVWTEKDPLKRKIAKKNNLNYRELFSIEEAQNFIYTF